MTLSGELNGRDDGIANARNDHGIEERENKGI